MQSTNAVLNVPINEFAPECQPANVSVASIDLSEPGQLKLLAKRIKDDIDVWCANKYDDGPRSHLGASLIGGDCDRDMWYTFRWIRHKKHSGRLQRLFQRGHLEEFRFVEYLRGIGFEVKEFADENGTQWRITGVNGHFGGSLDGMCRLPEHYQIGEPMLLEFKTQGTGSKFTALCKNGVAMEKPQHFSQMSVYGYKYGLRYALYMAVNKNDDDIHIEIVALDWKLGAQRELRAEKIITSQVPPPKLSETSAYQKCKWCDHMGVCHGQEMVSRNCRSCASCSPVENAQWFCSRYNANVPKDHLIKGCDNWQDITKTSIIPDAIIAKEITLTNNVKLIN